MLTRITLAALCGVGLAVAPARADDAKPAQQEKRCEKAGLNYLLYLPPDHDKADKPFPLILFLHGAGETGKDLKLVKKHGPPKIVEKKRDFEFIVVSPQAPKRGWQAKALLALLDEVTDKYKVDKDRIYLTGLSMGGFGTWNLAAEAPERFAAIAPICGGGAPSAAEKLKGLPIWVFHGAKDTIVKSALSQAMVDAVKKAGNEDVKFTLYPNAGHDSWTATYDNPDLYKWFLAHKRTK